MSKIVAAMPIVASALAVATILLGWAVGQYPYLLLPHVTIEQAARSHPTLVALAVALLVGGLIVVPSLVYLYRLFQRPQPGVATRVISG